MEYEWLLNEKRVNTIPTTFTSLVSTFMHGKGMNRDKAKNQGTKTKQAHIRVRTYGAVNWIPTHNSKGCMISIV